MTKTAKSKARWITRPILASAASFVLLSACMNERHLIGEGGPAGMGGGGSAGGSGGGSGGVTPDANDVTPDADGATPDADGAATDGPPSPDASTVDVIGLGDEPAAGWPLAISAEEVALRLSQFILRQPPSAALTTAIVAAAPRTNQDVGQLTDGLLLQEGSVAGRAAFYRWWLRFEDFATVARDPALFPLFTDEVRQAFIDQTLAFVEDVTWRADGDLATLLTEPAAYVSAATAPWFPGTAAVATGAEMTRVTLDAALYAGLLTQPPVLAGGPFAERPEPSRRGRDVRARFLCQTIPLEPVPTAPMAIPAGTTIREAVLRSAGAAQCAPCHAYTDPIGFAFGHFDAVGAFQLTEGGLAIDTTGQLQIANGQDPRSFTGAADLARIVADSPELESCFAWKWLAFARGKTANADEMYASSDDDVTAADAIYVVKRATVKGALNLRATIRAVTETHTFLDP